MSNGDRFFGPAMANGEIEGTGADILVPIDFYPQLVIVQNFGTLGMMEWEQGFDADTAIVTAITGARTVIGAGGITPGNTAFTIGSDPTVNILGEPLKWVAFRSFRS